MFTAIKDYFFRRHFRVDAGKCYRSRDGEVFGPLERIEALGMEMDPVYTFRCTVSGLTFTSTGLFCPALLMTTEKDLMAEEPNPAPNCTLELPEPFYKLGSTPLPSATILHTNGETSGWRYYGQRFQTVEDAVDWFSFVYDMNDAIARGDKVFWYGGGFICLDHVMSVTIENMPAGFPTYYRPPANIVCSA